MWTQQEQIALIIGAIIGPPIAFIFWSIYDFFRIDWLQQKAVKIAKERKLLEDMVIDKTAIAKAKADLKAKEKTAKQLKTDRQFVANKHKVVPLKGKALKESESKNRELYTNKK